MIYLDFKKHDHTFAMSSTKNILTEKMKHIFKIVKIAIVIWFYLLIFICTNFTSIIWSFEFTPYYIIDSFFRYEKIEKKYFFGSYEQIIKQMLDKSPLHTMIRLWYNVDSISQIKNNN